MTIVERLRARGWGTNAETARQAADEIQRLRAVLVYISEHGKYTPADQLALVALRALEPKP